MAKPVRDTTLPPEDMPRGLVPLPRFPYDRRPDSIPLDLEECRTALWLGRGNLLAAARLLKTEPVRLRRYISTSITLIEEQHEAKTLVLDRAEEIIAEALEAAEGEIRRDAAKFVLERLGKERGWGKNTGGGLTINGANGPIVISWAGDDDTPARDDIVTIDG